MTSCLENRVGAYHVQKEPGISDSLFRAERRNKHYKHVILIGIFLQVTSVTLTPVTALPKCP